MGMLAHLRMMSNSDLDRRFILAEGDHEIGRSVRCRIRIPLPSVTMRHALVRVDEVGLTIRPAATAAVIEINGQPCDSETALAAGDIIRIGSVRFVIDALSSQSSEVEGRRSGLTPGVEIEVKTTNQPSEVGGQQSAVQD